MAVGAMMLEIADLMKVDATVRRKQGWKKRKKGLWFFNESPTIETIAVRGLIIHRSARHFEYCCSLRGFLYRGVL